MAGDQAEAPWGKCVELTAGQLQVAARRPFDDSFCAGLVSTPSRPVLTQEGALALLQLVPPQVVLRGEGEGDGYRLTGCADLTRKLIASLQPETTVRCILGPGAAESTPAAALGTLMHKVCSIDELVAWATQPDIWEWWHAGNPTVNAVSKVFSLGRDRTAALLHRIAQERARSAESSADVKADAVTPVTKT